MRMHIPIAIGALCASVLAAACNDPTRPVTALDPAPPDAVPRPAPPSDALLDTVAQCPNHARHDGDSRLCFDRSVAAAPRVVP